MLCFCITSPVTLPPTSPAQATTLSSTPIEGVLPQALHALDNGGVAVGPCSSSYTGSFDGAYIDSNGETRSTVPQGSMNTTPCMQSYAKSDGTIYGWNGTSSATTMVAWKNGRQLWSVNTSSASSCNFNNSTDKGMWPISISEGADGELWLILRSIVEPWACQNRLVSLNADTGVMLYDIGIGSGPAPGSGLGGATPTAWTYDDAIIIVDPYGKVREFDYAGLETTTAAYQLPIPNGHKIRYLASNNDGTVFAITQAVWSAGQNSTLIFHKRSGGNGSIIDTSAGGVTEIVGLVPTHDGSVVAIGDYGKRLDYFNLTGSGSVNAVTPSPSLTGYNLNILSSYLEDTYGNRVYVWVNIDTVAGNRTTSVDVYNSSSTTTTRVYQREMRPSDPTNYPEFNIMNTIGSDSVGNGVLYFAICEMGYATCASTSTTPDMTLEAIDLESFGTPIDKGFKRNGYESDKLEYVAMGDSFSSGEGNDPFLSGTDLTGVDECHRSKDAYPLLLEEDTDLDLDLKVFTACSGATTSAVINGGSNTGSWNEGPQLDNLSTKTDLVTLSIGGNDIGFKDFMEACFELSDSCDSSSTIYSDTSGLIANNLTSSLMGVFAGIQTKIGVESNAKILVIGYPQIISNSSLGLGSPWSCITALSVGDLSALQSLAGDINSVIENAILSLDDERFHFVDPMVDSSFSEHDMCSDD